MTESWRGLNPCGNVLRVIAIPDERVIAVVRPILGVLCKVRNRAEWQIKYVFYATVFSHRRSSSRYFDNASIFHMLERACRFCRSDLRKGSPVRRSCRLGPDRPVP